MNLENALEQVKTWARVNSPWVIHFNSGSCNGCDIEILATLTPRYVLAQYLTAELGCEVALIGVQPARMGIGEELSPEVRNAVDEIVRLLAWIPLRQL